MNLCGVIVIPAGSGKTTLSNKYKNIYDIDSFLTEENNKKLNDLYKKTIITKNWKLYNKYEYDLIKDKINNLRKPFILLVHCKEKGYLLNLDYLGSCKICKNIMNEIAIERGKTNKLREIMTRDNWENTKCNIFKSFDDINNYVINICKKHKINISI